jgi:ppGpp synthetase/RelA/SpoT-type nucleotidyltranferase
VKAKSTNDPSEVNAWLNSDLEKYEQLTKVVAETLGHLLEQEGIEPLLISPRTKKRDRIHEKIRRKGYRDPRRELTDISGVRIVVHTESQVRKVSTIIARNFEIDKRNSGNKDVDRPIDQIGYRGTHFVCRLGSDRLKLPELTKHAGLKCEIQVNTALQHAWASFEHDRRYKFIANLPRDLERELVLYAGLIELADQGFERLDKNISNYIARIRGRIRRHDYNVELDSLSLELFVDAWCKITGFKREPLSDKIATALLVSELKDYGLKTLADVEKIIPAEYANVSKKLKYQVTIYGLVRDWMILADYHRAWTATKKGIAVKEAERRKVMEFYTALVEERKATEIIEFFEKRTQRN